MNKTRIIKMLENYITNDTKLKYCQSQGIELEEFHFLVSFKKIKDYMELMDEETAKILKLLYIEKMSLRRCAKECHFSDKTVIRKRDKGINELVEALCL